MPWSQRPDSSEHAEYYGLYIRQVPDGDVVERMDTQIADTLGLLRPLGDAQADHRYEPDKWSIREMVGHIVDTERVFAYRGLRFGRNDPTPLAGFEQDDWIDHGGFGSRPLPDILDEWEALRRSNVILFRSLEPEALDRRGVASGYPFSARSIPWILAGHELHHRRILEERYLSS